MEAHQDSQSWRSDDGRRRDGSVGRNTNSDKNTNTKMMDVYKMALLETAFSDGRKNTLLHCPGTESSIF